MSKRRPAGEAVFWDPVLIADFPAPDHAADKVTGKVGKFPLWASCDSHSRSSWIVKKLEDKLFPEMSLSTTLNSKDDSSENSVYLLRALSKNEFFGVLLLFYPSLKSLLWWWFNLLRTGFLQFEFGRFLILLFISSCWKTFHFICVYSKQETCWHLMHLEWATRCSLFHHWVTVERLLGTGPSIAEGGTAKTWAEVSGPEWIRCAFREPSCTNTRIQWIIANKLQKSLSHF